MTLGSRIKQRRCDIGMSVKELAAACGVEPSAVYQWQADTSAPTGPNIVRMAAALKTYEAWLVDASGPKVRAISLDTLTPHESEMMEAFRRLSPASQAAMRTTIMNLAESSLAKTEKM